MKSLWEPYMSWSDVDLLTRRMAKVQEQIIKSLIIGFSDNGKLKNHDFLSVELLELQDLIERIRAKKPKNDTTK